MPQSDPVILPVIFFGLILWLVLIFICIAYNIAIEIADKRRKDDDDDSTH